MNFNQVIKNELEQILFSYNFYINEEYNNYVCYSNGNFRIVISHNLLENTNSLWFGTTDGHNIEISDAIINNIINCNIKIENIPLEIFSKNILKLFKECGELLFDKNSILIKEIEQESYKQAKLYFKSMDNDYHLKIADKAWFEKDYSKFIITIEKLKLEDIPKSYEMKYNYAKKQLKK